LRTLANADACRLFRSILIKLFRPLEGSKPIFATFHPKFIIWFQIDRRTIKATQFPVISTCSRGQTAKWIKADPLAFLQSPQWQSPTRLGLPLTEKRTLPHRHPPMSSSLFGGIGASVVESELIWSKLPGRALVPPGPKIPSSAHISFQTALIALRP
jgi:hypothetical protein